MPEVMKRGIVQVFPEGLPELDGFDLDQTEYLGIYGGALIAMSSGAYGSHYCLSGTEKEP